MQKSIAILLSVFLVSTIAPVVSEAQMGRYPVDRIMKNGKIFDQHNYMQIPLTASENYLQGAVKSVTFKDIKIAGNGSAVFRVIDDSGYILYDSSGRLLEQKTNKPEGTYSLFCTYKYNGSKYEEWNCKLNGYTTIDSRSTFKYKQGRMIEKDETDVDPYKSAKAIYEYDKKGRQVEEIHYGSDGIITYIESYVYDHEGNQVEFCMRSADGRLLNKRTYLYDDNGNKSEGATYRSHDSTHAIKYTLKWDDKNRCIERNDFNKEVAPASKTLYKYDDKDNVTETLTYKPDGTIDETAWNAAYEYEFDVAGNITVFKCFRLQEGKRTLVQIVESTYTYYTPAKM